ncbi:MAG TPA: hypothetical protein VGE88_14950 [Lysobacter sp.]
MSERLRRLFSVIPAFAGMTSKNTSNSSSSNTLDDYYLRGR